MYTPNFLNDGLFFGVFRRKQAIGRIDANHWPVRGDRLHIQLVEFLKLAPLRSGCPRHARDVRVQTHQILQRDGPEHSALRLHPHAFFGFDGIVQSGGPTAILRNAAFEFVNRFNGIVLDDVINVAPQQGVGVNGVLHGTEDGKAILVEQVPYLERLFGQADSHVGKRDVAGEVVQVEMEAALPVANEAVGLGSEVVLGRIRPAGNHQGNASFVDENGVRLVDDCRVEWTVDLLIRMQAELVAQQIEAALIGGGVGDVARVGRAALLSAHA